MVRLTEVIAPAFWSVHRDIQAGRHTYYDFTGGRGSTKSSCISIEIVLGIMKDPQANAVVFRKVGNTISTSVFEQLLWAINVLGVDEKWRATTSPHKLIYKPTGQIILFRGLDAAQKMKSIKVSKGYIKYLWFEELDEFSGEEEIRSVQQSVLRGGPSFVVFKSFNPPISVNNWANQYVQTPREGAYRHKSCYLDVPREWLGQQFFDDAEELKRINPRAYEHEYLGVPVGAGGEVFDNIEIRELSDAEVRQFDRIYMGIDWGWYPDPFVWMKMHFDPTRRVLYLFDEYRCNKKTNAETWAYLRDVKGVRPAVDLITADSAEHKSTADYRSYGAFCRDAIKGPDSIRYGIKWLQSLSAIVIDPKRCPGACKEFQNYEYERTKDGSVISAFPDADNHSIDAVRYAMEQVWRRKGR